MGRCVWGRVFHLENDIDMCNEKCNNMYNKKCIGGNMRENTYIKIETLYSKYRGYVGTKNLLAEGFSNRQISTLVEKGI